MTTFEELITSIEVERDQAVKRRSRAVAEVKAILAKARNEGRSNLTEEEDADVQAAFTRREQANRDLEGIETKLANARKAKEAEEEIDGAAEERTTDPKTTASGAKPAYDRVARVVAEERTYHEGNCKRGGQFIRDVIGQYLYRDPHAEQRLVRHMQEERVERGEYLQQRAGGTGNFSGLVVPQFLTELYAPRVRARRPFADACNSHDLPEEGMEVNISRITTGSSVAIQASQNDPVDETDVDDSLLTVNVQTAAGQQSLSRQAVDRGRGIDDVVMDDLQRAWAASLDSTLLNQSSTGLTNVAESITHDETEPTVEGLYPKVLQGLSQSEAALLGFANPDIAVMHSRRWYWLNSLLTDKHPLIAQPQVPGNAAGVNLAEVYGSGFRGILPNGTVVIADNNITTSAGDGNNEDEIYIAPSDECHLWEDPNAPQFIRAEQAKAANLSVLLVLYSYFAYTFERFSNATQKIAGTGLVAPTFG